MGGNKTAHDTQMRIGRNNLAGISKGDIRRLARRGGVKRMRNNNDLLGHVRCALHGFLERVLKSAIPYAEHAHRHTLTEMDVVYGLKREGISLYGGQNQQLG